MIRSPLRHIPLCSLAFILLAQGVEAQRTYDQEKMKASYAKMLTHDWFTGGGWVTSLEEAKKESKKTGKPIFAYFTRTFAF